MIRVHKQLTCVW